jgi:hypothetical protein
MFKIRLQVLHGWVPSSMCVEGSFVGTARLGPMSSVNFK